MTKKQFLKDMKKILVLGVVAAMAFASCNTTSKTPKSELDSVAYAYSSLQFGPHVAFLDSVEHLSVDMIVSAIYDVVGGKSKMTQEEAEAFLNEYFTVRKPAQALKEAEEFLAGKEATAGVQKTESGLLYEIIEAGGEKATDDADTVVVLYKGTLPNGTVFDETTDGQTREFPLNGVIPAWTEGMKLVGKGGKVNLYVHPDLAYGSRGAGQSIGPNQALMFEVEIVDIKPAALDAE